MTQVTATRTDKSEPVTSWLTNVSGSRCKARGAAVGSVMRCSTNLRGPATGMCRSPALAALCNRRFPHKALHRVQIVEQASVLDVSIQALASVHPETLSFWNRWLNSDF